MDYVNPDNELSDESDTENSSNKRKRQVVEYSKELSATQLKKLRSNNSSGLIGGTFSFNVVDDVVDVSHNKENEENENIDDGDEDETSPEILFLKVSHELYALKQVQQTQVAVQHKTSLESLEKLTKEFSKSHSQLVDVLKIIAQNTEKKENL